MQKKTKRHWWIGLLFAIALITAGYWCWWQAGAQTLPQTGYKDTGVVTIFVPGYGSNWTTFAPMVKRFENVGATSQVTTVHIANDGARKWSGAQRFDGKNPLLNVIFENSKAPRQELTQLTALIDWLTRKKGVTRINLVGHSLGSNIAFRYLVNPRPAGAPEVVKYINFASDFRPQQLAMIDRLPKDVQMLSIGGRIWGAKGDWAVPLAGVEHFATATKKAGYASRLYVYEGSPVGAWHITLHQNPYVDAVILRFLFT